MTTNLTKNEIVNLSIEILIKAVLLGIVLFYAFSIIKPFIIPVLWAVIIAVSLAPFVDKMSKKFVNKRKMIIIFLTVFMVGALLIPTYLLSESVIGSSEKLAHDLKHGTLVIPAPTENIKEWPIVGENIYNVWNSFAVNLGEALHKYAPEVKEYAASIASMIGGSLMGILQFVASLVIAALFLMKSEGSVSLYHAISKRLLGERGIEWAHLSALTIRSVVQGVIGIATIQGVLAFVGFALIDLPLPWLWASLVFFLGIIQVPQIVLVGPIVAYVFSYAETTPATIFSIYILIVGFSDGALKPLLLGRGVDIPMLVILLGAIGGMILSGILGLFVGAVGLSIAYKLFTVWLEEEFDTSNA